MRDKLSEKHRENNEDKQIEKTERLRKKNKQRNTETEKRHT